MRVVYFDHRAGEEPQEGFRSGVAGYVVLTEAGTLETEPRVRIGPNSHCALVCHGVVEALNRLPQVEGPLGPDVDGVIHAGGLSRASRLLYEADRKTYGATWEFVVSATAEVEYRVAIDNREYQRTLSRLQYLVTMAGRLGHAVWLRL